MLAGDEHLLAPISKTPCTYYVIKFKTAHQPEANNDPGSFTVDWNQLKFVPHDKGGRRDVVDKRTIMFERFEMHVTTLNPGLASHDPHSHTPEEIILIKEGNVEMNVGDKKVKASAG
ncbi:MAG: cupin domain-containing protein [Bacteroidota bacterium]